MFNVAKISDHEYKLSGRLDAAEADNVRPVFDAIDSSAILDCKEMEYISSIGLGMLLGTQLRLKKSNGGLTLINVTKFVRDVLSLTGFDKILEIREN